MRATEDEAMLTLCRRAFLGAGLGSAALATLPFGAGIAAAGATFDRPSLAIVDRRFRQAAAFGKALRTQGVETRSYKGDLTGLWANELDLRWRAEPEVTIGMTSTGAMHCLQLLVAGYRMRVIDQAHVAALSKDEALVTWIIAPLTGARGRI